MDKSESEVDQIRCWRILRPELDKSEAEVDKIRGWRIVRPELDKSETEVDQIKCCWRQHTQLGNT